MKNKLKELETTRKDLVDLETFNCILKDLAKPDTSLYHLTRASSEIQVLATTEEDSFLVEQYNYILEELDLTINSLVDLHFRDTLDKLLIVIETTYISCTIATNYLYLLEKALVQIGYNVALEQYIFEDNVTVL